ncbi:unnamed protein product [Adineta steineri]|uniref:Uncharacterized protein n=1 Tax=Adineta steineri TaxID=433720 RepID=A0A819SCU8_9BILA|nr:unnamed protein product [Adineta steineri]
MKALILFFFLILSLTDNSSAAFTDFFHKIFSKDHCPIELYNPKDTSFTGHAIYANVDTFYPLLESLSTYAKDCRVKINIKQSFIQEDPSKSFIMLRDFGAMEFRLGQAIEYELVDQDNNLLCNRRCMKKRLSKLSGLPDAKCFLQKLSHNSDIRRDRHNPTILMKRTESDESLMKLHDVRKELQNKCKKLRMKNKNQ